MARRRAPGRGSTYPEAGRWRAQLRWPGGRKVRRWADSQTEAEKVLDALRAMRDGGVSPEEQTVGQWLDYWITSLCDHLKPKTREGYAQQARDYIKPTIGTVQLARLNPQHVRTMLDDVTDAGRGPETVRAVRVVLHSALKQAEAWDLVQRNAATPVRGPKVPNVERTTFTPDEAARFLDAVAGNRLEAAFVVAASVGLRRGEVLGLLWEDVDFDAKQLHVRRELTRSQGEYLLTEPKTPRSIRTVPLPDFVDESLRRRRDIQRWEREQAGELWEAEWPLVFTTTAGRPTNGDWLYRHFLRILEAAELPRITFHDLRRCASSTLLAQGVDGRVRQAILGHASITTTEDIYTHVPKELLRDAADKMQQWREGD